MTDELITDLAQVSGLQVISRTSAMQYKGVHRPVSEIAKRLNVEAVVEGTVSRSGNLVRINTQLIDGRTDRHLWARGYVHDLSEIVALQHEMARKIVMEMVVGLTPQERSRLAITPQVDPEAYQLYLKGRYFWNKRTEDALQRAITYFQEALEKDPNLAAAHAAIADCYVVLGAWNLNALAPADSFLTARSSALKALEINPDSAEAYTELSSVHALYDRDWSAAEKESKRAIELNPGYALAHQRYGAHLAQVGRFDEGIAQSKVAQHLDPLSLMVGTSLGERFYWARRYDEAIVEIQSILQMDPNFVPAHHVLGQIYEQKAMLPEAIAEFKRTVDDSNHNAVYLAALGHAYAISGQRTRALRILEELRQLSLRRYVSAYGPALISVGLGEDSNAIKWLEKAYQEHSILLANAKIDPRLDPLRSDPRFESLLRRIGLRP
jgi:tetratricopeptide (TPR) repeat protein